MKKSAFTTDTCNQACKSIKLLIREVNSNNTNEEDNIACDTDEDNDDNEYSVHAIGQGNNGKVQLLNYFWHHLRNI